MRNANSTTWARRGSPLVVRLAATGVIVVAAALSALPVHAEARHGHGMGGPGGGAMMMFGGQPEHVARAVDHMLNGLNATDAQRSQIKQIAMAAAADLKAQRDASRGLRQNGMQVFTAPNVDAAAAESVRQQMLAQHDQSSRRVLQAMLDVSRVLTPEQRAMIGERMKQREAAMRGRMQHEPRQPTQR